jgi:hypothetical protein
MKCVRFPFRLAIKSVAGGRQVPYLQWAPDQIKSCNGKERRLVVFAALACWDPKHINTGGSPLWESLSKLVSFLNTCPCMKDQYALSCVPASTSVCST